MAVALDRDGIDSRQQHRKLVVVTKTPRVTIEFQ